MKRNVSDKKALDLIAQWLSQEWSSDVFQNIADIVLDTGREIEDCNTEESA